MNGGAMMGGEGEAVGEVGWCWWCVCGLCGWQLGSTTTPCFLVRRLVRLVLRPNGFTVVTISSRLVKMQWFLPEIRHKKKD
jgi:hypothetical protein